MIDSFSVEPIAGRASRLWYPKRVLFTPDTLREPFGQRIYERITRLGLPVEVLSSNRLTGLRGATERETYRQAKQTLAIVNAPPSALKFQPIPPSADWQFHLAQGCPAHCQYCYLAGSLQGPPVVRAYANLPAILEATQAYERPHQVTTFEASCYTDPLSLEHLTGSLSTAIQHFATRPGTQLRWVTKFHQVAPLLNLPHAGRTRARISLNAAPVARYLEAGTSSLPDRLAALRQLAQAGYPVGVVLAPIMPLEDWPQHYGQLLDALQATLDFPVDLTFELISHRFTPGSKEVLQRWYPQSKLEMDEAQRAVKRNKFGGLKYVYRPEEMRALRMFFTDELARRFPQAPILYWT
ncbi:spore photoproduct lyase [Catalinimonas alkaloidigena]|uniref:Spore photoproduct lyase n=1 Tax=Catalinimonas alkaloidigena TaxID=1075417 RepID=A0A1G9IJE3_9BACT|nr:radical SAM protein [Catalinimonas alkaloidigena]SDL24974.1 spore photoproduct lyase [Catalinimonas alkaloidigena]